MARLATLLALVAAALSAAAPAAAQDEPPPPPYKLDGVPWPKHHGIARITYYNTVPEQAAALKHAARVWNRSGANIRFVPAPPKKAQLKVIPLHRFIRTDGGKQLGNATVGYVPHRKARLRIFRPQDLPTGVDQPETWEEVLVHEFGHVLGLLHVEGHCSIMNVAEYWGGCPAPEEWEIGCRWVEAADVAGAIRRYGGKPEPLGPRYCASVPAPGPPTELTASANEFNNIMLSWRNSTDPGVRGVWFRVFRGSCPASISTVRDLDDYHWSGDPGEREEDLAPVEGFGHFCVAMWSEGQKGRPGNQVATVSFDRTNRPPQVDSMSATPEETSLSYNGGSVQVCAQASDVEGYVQSYTWNFGDGSPSDPPSPYNCGNHTYTATGTYTVSVTVTDENGGTGTGSMQLTVVP